MSSTTDTWGSDMEIVRYHTDTGHTSALIVERGRKWMHIIPMESHAVRIRRVRLSEERNMSPLQYKGKPYPVTRALRHFKRHAKDFGITKTAQRALRRSK